MDIENQLVIYCEDDREFRVYCDICDELCIQRVYKNHLKSQTHISGVRKRDQLKKIISNNLIYLNICNTIIAKNHPLI